MGTMSICRMVGGGMLLAALWKALFSGVLPASEHSSITNL